MKILYLFPSPKKEELDQVQNYESPSDRLYGVYELQNLGHHVEFHDNRFKGILGKMIRWARNSLGISLYDFKTYLNIRHYDVVVVKNNFSLLITLACRFWNTRVVYLDALFWLPRKNWRKLLHWINFRLIQGVICYSKKQIEIWMKSYNVNANKFAYLPYAIDTSFCHKNLVSDDNEKKETDYILSIGRDKGRDFATLIKAMEGLNLNLKLVTVPQRVDNESINRKFIQYYNNISYQELFELYANAKLIVLPLHAGIIYPAGIRGLLEAMALRKAIIVTRTPILEEYVRDKQEVIFVDPENPDQLRHKILMLNKNQLLRNKLRNNASKVVNNLFDINIFAMELSRYLNQLGENQNVHNKKPNDLLEKTKSEMDLQN